MTETQCAVCQKPTNTTKLYPANFDVSAFNKDVFSARRMPDRIHYEIVRCNDCGLVFSNPILEPEKIENLYRKSELNYDEQIAYMQKTYGDYLEMAMKHAATADSLLEIGGGNSFFLEEALRRGVKKVFGVEPSEDAIAKTRSDIRPHIHVGYLEKNTYPENSFDIITIFQTFDHLINPNKILQACHQILKPRGIVLAINHNISHVYAKILGEKCPMIDIEHIYLYNPETFRKIFNNNKFGVIKVFPVKNIYPIKYWLRLLPLPFKKTLLNILPRKIFNIPLKLNAGNMGIIAQKHA